MRSGKSKALVSVALVYPVLVGCLIFHEDMARVFPYIVGVSSLVPMSTTSFWYYKLWKIVKNNRKQYLQETGELTSNGEWPKQWV